MQAYDFFWEEIVLAYPYPFYAYRDPVEQHDIYQEDVRAKAFCKRACSSTRIKKPFVFVEGFSFDKPTLSQQEYNAYNYFEQDASLLSHPQIIQIFNRPDFDPNLDLGYSTFNWGTFCTGVDAEGLVSGNPLQVQKLPDLLNKLYDASYDIIFIDFRQGTQYIQNNAMALVKVLETLEDSLQASGSNEKITVCGASMGGLISRYALNYLHQNGNPHLVDKFISFDSPQRGANIPFSLQCLLTSLIPMGSEDIKEKYDGVTSPAASQMLLTSVLETSLFGPVTYTTPQCSQERTYLLNDPMFQWNFNAKKISIINGSRYGGFQVNPNFHSGDPGINVNGFLGIEMSPVGEWSNSYDKILDFDFGNFNCSNISIPFGGVLMFPNLMSQTVRVRRTLNAEKCAGSYRNDYVSLVQSLNDLGDFVIGLNAATNPFFSSLLCSAIDSDMVVKFERNCFIPALSAMSFKSFDNAMKTADASYLQSMFQGNAKFEDPNHLVSDFDVIYAPSCNQTHVEITNENIDWLLDEVIADKFLKFQNENIPPGIHLARETISAGRNVNKPNTPVGIAVALNNAFTTLRSGERILLEPGFYCNAGMGGVAGTFIAEIYGNVNCPKSMLAADHGEERHDLPQSIQFVSRPSDQTLASAAHTYENFSQAEIKMNAPGLKIYPNPTEGEITIEQSSEEYQMLEVYNAIGVRVKLIPLRKATERIRLDELASGLYTLTCPRKPEFTYRILKK
jgi:hypothetical protein